MMFSKEIMNQTLTDRARRPMPTGRETSHSRDQQRAHISKVSIEHLYVSVDDLQGDELVISGANPANEEQRCVTSVDDLRVCIMPVSNFKPQYNTLAPLYSRKLHILVLRANTNCVTSFTILAFCFCGIV